MVLKKFIEMLDNCASNTTATTLVIKGGKSDKKEGNCRRRTQEFLISEKNTSNTQVTGKSHWLLRDFVQNLENQTVSNTQSMQTATSFLLCLLPHL